MSFQPSLQRCQTWEWRLLQIPPATSWINQVTRQCHEEQKIHSDFLCPNLWPRDYEYNIMTTDLSHRIWDGLLVSSRNRNHGGCLHKKITIRYAVISGKTSVVLLVLHCTPINSFSYFWQRCSGTFLLHSNSKHILLSPYHHHKTLPCPKLKCKRYPNLIWNYQLKILSTLL